VSKWKKETFKLKKKHKWAAKPGHRIFVVGRGAVRFDIPQSWVLKPDEDSIKFYDLEPPDDNIRLECSFNQLPAADWDSFPLETLMPQVLEDDHRGILSRGEVISLKRKDLRLVWMESSFQDPGENRLAYTRAMIGLGGNVQCLITIDFWPEHRKIAESVWNDVIDSLKLGVYILDPTTGTPLTPDLN
jgi:hypothetical protein